MLYIAIIHGNGIACMRINNDDKLCFCQVILQSLQTLRCWDIWPVKNSITNFYSLKFNLPISVALTLLG